MFNKFKIFILITTLSLISGEYYSSLTNGKLVIHHNEMTTEMEDHAIFTTIQAFDSSEDHNLVAKTIAHAFGNKYGGLWNCLLGNGNGNISGSQLTYQSGTYIAFSIGEVHVILFRVKDCDTTNNEPNEEKIITEAKNSLHNNVAVSYNSNLDETIESKVIQTIVETLKSGSNAYQTLATKIKNALSIQFGENWSVVIGRDDAFDFEHPSNLNGSLDLMIGNLNLLAYHFICKTCVNAQQTVNILNSIFIIFL
jgi:hypothetical protein